MFTKAAGNMMDLHKKKNNVAEADAFDELIAPVYISLYNYIYCILRNRTLAEDAVQETMVKAYKNINKLKDQSKFKSWIFTIGRNESINILRKYRREVLSDDVACTSAYDDFYFPEDFALKAEIKEFLVASVNSLDSQDRDIIILKYYVGLTLQDIAGILNINSNTVRTRHRIIKKRLYDELKNEGLV
jgi:RNA polymerase sigma-70 factor (ECF subfamily)